MILKYLIYSILSACYLNMAFSQPYVEPFKFGAVGDGRNDDSESLVKAIAYCELHAINLKLGNAKNTFLVSKPLTIKKPFHLYGSGTLKKAGNSNFVLLSIFADNFILDGIRLDGNSSEQHAFGLNNSDLMVINASKLIIKNATFRNSAGNALSLFNSANCYIFKNQIYNSRVNALLIADGASNNNVVERNVIDLTHEQNGIFITASSGSIQTNVHLTGNVIKENTVRNAGDIGIESSIHADHTFIIGNKVFHSKNDHIIIRDNQYSIVSGNYCAFTGSGTGIAISVLDLVGGVDHYFCKIYNNQIIDARNAGILVAGNNVDVFNNTLSGVKTGGGIGISVQKDFVSMENNKIDGFGTGVKEFIKVSSKKYRNNKISNAITDLDLMP